MWGLNPGPSIRSKSAAVEKGIQPTPPSPGVGCSGDCPNTSLKNPVGFTSSFSAVCGITPQRRAQAKGDRESLDWSGHTCWQRCKEAKLKDQAEYYTRTPSRGLGPRAHRRQLRMPAPASLALYALLPGPPSVSLRPAFPPSPGVCGWGLLDTPLAGAIVLFWRLGCGGRVPQQGA